MRSSWYEIRRRLLKGAARADEEHGLGALEAGGDQKSHADHPAAVEPEQSAEVQHARVLDEPKGAARECHHETRGRSDGVLGEEPGRIRIWGQNPFSAPGN